MIAGHSLVRHGLGRWSARLAAVAMAAALAACASSSPPPVAPAVVLTMPNETAPPAPRIVSAGRPLQCVEYAREASGIQIFGDAATWWSAAAGLYARGHLPEPGSLLVFGPKGGSSGHLAVVTRVLDARHVVASHANWLNDRLVHENTPIKDVSPAGDWSAVRVWYIPGNTWGARIYPTYGFIYPRGLQTAGVATP